MACITSTGLDAPTLYRSEGLSPDVKAAVIPGARVQRSSLLEFLRIGLSARNCTEQLTEYSQVEGLETIRSFGWRREVIQDSVWCVENAQRSEFLLLSLQRWLNIVLDLLVAAAATSAVAIAVAFQGRISGGQVGIALNVMLAANTILLRLVENWTQLEISLGAVARLKTLEKMTPSEGGKSENFEPPKN